LVIEVELNGKPRNVPEARNVREFLSDLGIKPRLVVVEINGVVVYPEKWDGTTVVDGDKVEVVSIAGGG